MPARRPRIGREEAPEVAERGRPEQRVGHGVEQDVAVRMTGQGRARRRSRPRRGATASRARTDGCRGRSRSASSARPSSAAAARRRSAGRVTLRLSGIARHDMDGDAGGLEQGRLVGERVGAVRREPAPGRAQQVAPRALRRLGGAEPVPVDRPDDQVAVDPLEGLGDRHDRDRGAVPGGRGRDRGDERRRRPAAGRHRGRARRRSRRRRRDRGPRTRRGPIPGVARRRPRRR